MKTRKGNTTSKTPRKRFKKKGLKRFRPAKGKRDIFKTHEKKNK